MSLQAVQRAIESCRLDESLVMVPGRGGRDDPKIRDAAEADREWDANTRAPRADADEDVEAIEAGEEEGLGDGEYSMRMKDAQRRREIELWRQARIKRQADELELAQRRGELVSVADARARVIEKYTVVKTRLLGVPSRCKQRMPHLSASDVRAITALIREALEELSGGSAVDGG